MAPWLLQALKTIALFVGGGAAFEAGQRALPGGDDDFFFAGVPDVSGGVRRVIDQFGRPVGDRRRRRRRALTASDRQDIAFIAGMISKAAAKDFAVQLAARPR